MSESSPKRRRLTKKSHIEQRLERKRMRREIREERRRRRLERAQSGEEGVEQSEEEEVEQSEEEEKDQSEEEEMEQPVDMIASLFSAAAEEEPVAAVAVPLEDEEEPVAPAAAAVAAVAVPLEDEEEPMAADDDDNDDDFVEGPAAPPPEEAEVEEPEEYNVVLVPSHETTVQRTGARVVLCLASFMTKRALSMGDNQEADGGHRFSAVPPNGHVCLKPKHMAAGGAGGNRDARKSAELSKSQMRRSFLWVTAHGAVALELLRSPLVAYPVRVKLLKDHLGCDRWARAAIGVTETRARYGSLNDYAAVMDPRKWGQTRAIPLTDSEKARYTYHVPVGAMTLGKTPKSLRANWPCLASKPLLANSAAEFQVLALAEHHLPQRISARLSPYAAIQMEPRRAPAEPLAYPLADLQKLAKSRTRLFDQWDETAVACVRLEKGREAGEEAPLPCERLAIASTDVLHYLAGKSGLAGAGKRRPGGRASHRPQEVTVDNWRSKHRDLIARMKPGAGRSLFLMLAHAFAGPDFWRLARASTLRLAQAITQRPSYGVLRDLAACPDALGNEMVVRDLAAARCWDLPRDANARRLVLVSRRLVDAAAPPLWAQAVQPLQFQPLAARWDNSDMAPDGEFAVSRRWQLNARRCCYSLLTEEMCGGLYGSLTPVRSDCVAALAERVAALARPAALVLAASRADASRLTATVELPATAVVVTVQQVLAARPPLDCSGLSASAAACIDLGEAGGCIRPEDVFDQLVVWRADQIGYEDLVRCCLALSGDLSVNGRTEADFRHQVFLRVRKPARCQLAAAARTFDQGVVLAGLALQQAPAGSFFEDFWFSGRAAGLVQCHPETRWTGALERLMAGGQVRFVYDDIEPGRASELNAYVEAVDEAAQGTDVRSRRLTVFSDASLFEARTGAPLIDDRLAYVNSYTCEMLPSALPPASAIFVVPALASGVNGPLTRRAGRVDPRYIGTTAAFWAQLAAQLDPQAAVYVLGSRAECFERKLAQWRAAPFAEQGEGPAHCRMPRHSPPSFL